MKQKWRTKRLLALALLLASVLGLAWASRITSVSVAGTEPEATPTLPSHRFAELKMASVGGEWSDLASSSALFTEPVEVLEADNNYFLKVNLRDSRVRFQVVLANNDNGGLQSLAGMKSRFENQGYAAWAIVNGDLFSGSCSGDVNCAQGLTYIDGERRWNAPGYGNTWQVRGNLGLDESNNVEINVGDGQSKRHMTIGGGPRVLMGGGTPTCQGVPGDIDHCGLGKTWFPASGECFDDDVREWCSRTDEITMLGYSADGQYLYMGVSRGGKTVTQLAQWLKDRGAHEILRLDSGGSTGMYHNGALIESSDDNRAIANAFGLIVESGPPPSPPPAPSLSSPPNGHTFVSCANITLDWNESSGASEYYAEYWGTGSDNWGWGGGTDWNIGIKSPGTYSWHARARNEHGESDWSDTWSFTVNPNQAPNTPSPQSPGDGTWVNNRSPTLQWSTPSDDGCPRGLTYNAQIERITGGSWSTSISDHSGTSWSPSLPSDDDYRWHVQAYDGDLTSGWSGYRTVKVDATSPDTTINNGPSGIIPTGSATFTWTGSDNRTSTGDLEYSYRLVGLSNDWSSWSTATSVTYNDLTDGDYTFEVKARDLAGNVDPSPANRSFGVDVTPPETTITGGPSGCIGTADVTFTWTGSDNRTLTAELLYSCKLEGFDADWSAWTGATSKSYTGLPDGDYTFKVKAQDGVGHEDPSPAARSFRVDTTPPTGSVLINGGDSTTNKIAVHLDITGDDGPVGCGVTEMRLSNDDHNWKAWQPFTTEGAWLLPTLNRTTWTVHLQLKDLVGNVSEAFTNDIYLDLYPPRPSSESYQLGARVVASGHLTSTSESYGLLSATMGQPIADGRMQGAAYRLESGYQGAWPSVPRGRLPPESYDINASLVASSGEYQASESYRLQSAMGQSTDVGPRSSENYQLLSGYLPCKLVGDLDVNGRVDVVDIMKVASRWRMMSDDPEWEARYDLDGDGIITVVDIMMVAANWGQTC